MLRWEHVDYGNRIFHQGVWAFTFNIVMGTSGQAVPRQIGWGSNSWQKREKCKKKRKTKLLIFLLWTNTAAYIWGQREVQAYKGCYIFRQTLSIYHWKELWPLTVLRFSWRLFFINKNPWGMMWPLYSFAYWNHNITWLNYQRDYSCYLASLCLVAHKASPDFRYFFNNLQVKSWYKSSKPYSCTIKN